MEHMNHDDMPGMHHHGGDDEGASSASDSMPMGSSSMAMTFFQSMTTPLLFHGAQPTTAGQYAGACILIVLLGILACVLLQLKAVLQRTVWTSRRLHEGQPLLEDDEKAAAKALNSATDATDAPPPGSLGIRTEAGRWLGAWRSTSLLQRAAMASYEILLATLGYILMLVVMTMNIGYFFSAIAGLWMGTFLVGTVSPATDKSVQHC
ncbi:Ctr copper transporter family-domain-containing protein [Immersiella caudata]|uniref:Copper transport protein n=1 Tax=Immersiella caudata TaxID=314043 RepID=A0AA40BZB7_9PEZI|nr:Ctr copper transporter family-domain-containing protein [Immersiella caudata]